MTVLDLLLSRRAAADGVGIGTRRNRVLPPAVENPAIPERVGRGAYKVRKPKDGADDIFSPLVETSFAARTYHALTRLWSHNRLLSLPIRPVKTISVQSGGASPKTLKICLAHEATPASGVYGDLTETTREAVSDWLIKQTNATVTNMGLRRLFFCYDQRWDSMIFQRKGQSSQLFLSGAASYPELHGLVAGVHDHALTIFDRGAIQDLSFRRRTTNTLLYISFLATFGFLENLANTAVRQAGDTYEARRRLAGFNASVRGFCASSGFYTETDRATLIYPVTKSEPVYSAARPRHYKFVSEPDLVFGNIRLPSDAIFNNGACGPVQPMTLSDSDHLYRDGNGIVWQIIVSWSWNSAPKTHTLKVYVVRRYDAFMENPPAGFTLLAEQTFPDENQWAGDHYNTPTTTAPAYTWLRNLPNGREAMWIAEHHCLVKIAFSGDGAEPTGAGIVVTMTQIHRMQHYSYTSVPPTEAAPGYTDEHKREILNAYALPDNTWSYLVYDQLYRYDAEIVEYIPENWTILWSQTVVTNRLETESEAITQTYTTRYDLYLPSTSIESGTTNGTVAGPSLGSFENDKYVMGRTEFVKTNDVIAWGDTKYVGTFHQGKVVPFGTDVRLAAINPRDGSVYIAPSAAAAGVFY